MKSHILLVHGYNTNAESNYFPTLKTILEAYGIVYAPNLPEPQHPTENDWIETLNQYGVLEYDIIYAHSLGCKAAIEFIRQKNIKVKNLILAGGFNALDVELQQRPYNNSFHWGNDIQIGHLVEKVVCVIDKSDDKVDPNLSKDLAQQVHADIVYVTSNVPHFRSDREDALIELLVDMIK